MIAPLMPTYARADLAFERGEGAWLTATNGKQYLDFSGGVAVNALGHAHPALIKALTEQAQKVWHVSNLFRIPEAERLAARLVEASFADTVFFGNSGAEAMEGAIKTARKYHAVSGAPERTRIIAFESSFHGRTLATLSAAGAQKYLEGFGEPLSGFDHVKYGDLDAAKKAITKETAAILAEPIQGESGVRVPPPSFLRGLRELCDQHEILLVLDEVQTGMGRSGKLFAYEWTGIKPDILGTAKGIGGGFPLGAVLATAEAAKGMTAGTHGSTFGGNLVAAAAACVAFDLACSEEAMAATTRKSARMFELARAVQARNPGKVKDVRGKGLLMGIEIEGGAADVVARCRGNGLLVNMAGEKTARFAPAFVATDEQLVEGLSLFERSL